MTEEPAVILLWATRPHPDHLTRGPGEPTVMGLRHGFEGSLNGAFLPWGASRQSVSAALRRDASSGPPPGEDLKRHRSRPAPVTRHPAVQAPQRPRRLGNLTSLPQGA